MVSGNKSKAARGARPVVVRKKSTPWGLITAVTVVVLFAAGIFGYVFVQNQAKQAQAAALAAFTPTPEKQDPSTQIPGVQVVPFGGLSHIEANVQVAYTHNPPMGGTHDFAWAACNGVVYPQAVRSENLVHSMEHGAVWIAYNPDQITGDALEALQEKVENQPYTVMSPYPGLDQPIAVQSWGHQLKLTDPQDERIDQFIAALRLNQYAYPEPGATCNELGAANGFSQDNPPPFAPPPAPGTPGSQPETVPGAGATPAAGS